jgi:folylpolyglutamate synthase/dihydropteroate synthase
MAGHLASDFEIIADPAQALARALELAQPDDAVFVTGSLYLVGDLRASWNRRLLPVPASPPA